MSKGTLKSLSIHNLRGSVTPFTLTFDKDKKLSVIYGENGTGKSTICDAFDFLGKGNVGSLDGRGLGKTNKYWHSLGATPNDVSVTLEHSVGSCTATLGKAGVIINPFEIPNVEVLRRGQILKLVEAKPADRYAAISQFIDVSGIETSENNLRKLIRDIESNVDLAVARVQENQDTISRFWVEAGSPGAEAIVWAKQESEKNQSEITLSRAAVEALKSNLEKLNTNVLEYKSKTDALTLARTQLNEAEEAITSLNDGMVGEYEKVLDILLSAQEHFLSHPNQDVCPLCESDQKIIGLAARINERIESQGIASQLKVAKSKRDEKKQIVDIYENQLTDINDKAISNAEVFVLSAKNENLPTDIETPNLEFPESINLWDEWLKNSQQLLLDWGQVADNLISNEKFFRTLKSSLETLIENSQVKNDLNILLPHLKSMLNVIETERKSFTDGVLHKIAVEVGKLYEVVHPNEGLNKITLELDPVKRASLEISTEFRGQNSTPPQAYFSDSHLDTLGLCVFLALAKMDKPEETILVLDDVLGSVDEPHVDRLIEMLYAEAISFRQCIITTHYRPWKQKLRWGWLGNGQCQFVELNKWTSIKGISLTKSIPDIERLRLLLSETPPDPQLICAKAGVILEAALDFLTLLYECLVPRRTDSLYTLGDLLPAIDKKLRASLRVEHKQKNDDGTFTYIEKILSPHLEEITRIAQARNIFGCHFNTISFDFLEADAIQFSTEVLGLMDCLVDHEIGWPRNQKSGSYWATAGETRRLHPLKRPS